MMEEMTIKKNRSRPEALDYQLLRQYGLDYIAKLGNKLWSDYNIHDPGITALEALCYALTDLGYRASFEMKDILTPPGSRSPDTENALIPAHEILPVQPITTDDYRKWILETIPGVRNAWVEKCEDLEIKGLYRIVVDMYLDKLKENKNDKYRPIFGKNITGHFVSGKVFQDDLKKYCRSYIRNMYLKIRNLCEDLVDVVILNPLNVGICANIEIETGVKHEQVVEEIGKRMNEYINPAIRYYTLAQMLEKGKSVEEIYRGFVPKYNGFTDKDELDRFKKIEQLNISDAINLIMDIEGVANVRHLHFVVGDQVKDELYEITKFRSVKLKDKNYSFRFCCNSSKLHFTQGSLSFPSQTEITIKDVAPPDNKVSDAGLQLPLPQGNNRQLDEYISIQDEFPKTYKTGREGIADSETDLRKAQRLQFKAYLLFFDQLLADYLAQLNAVKDIFAWKDKDNTCLFKNLTDDEITDFSKLLNDSKAYKTEEYGNIIEPEYMRNDRRNRFLNHLIARFNEEFVDYSMLKFLNQNEKADDGELAGEEKPIAGAKTLIDRKKYFLKNYANLSRERSHAFDYTEPFKGGTGLFNRARNVCGLEDVLYHRLGLDAEPVNHRLIKRKTTAKGKFIFTDNRAGSHNERFGVHVYEHILMRPLSDTDALLKLASDIHQTKTVKDPYSFQITAAVPGWLNISANAEYRKFIERIIHTEIPAHIATKICWLNPYQMYMMETGYEKFLSVLAKQPYLENTWDEWKDEHAKALMELLATFSTLRSIYPPARLYSDDYRITGEYSAILDYSMLEGDNDGYGVLWEYDVPDEE